MKTKSIIIVILLSGFVCFGIPDILADQQGTGIAQAQNENADARRLVQDLEDALKSRDPERIRLAQQRVNSHQQASRILKQLPALQRRLQAAIKRVPSQTLKSQTAISSTPRKETLNKQAIALKSPAGLSSATGFQGTAAGMGTAGGIKSASQPVSSQVRGMSREGTQSMGGRAEGVSSSTTTGMGSTGMQGFSSRREGFTNKTGAGISSSTVKGIASETASGFSSKEQGVKAIGNTEKAVGTAAVAGSGLFVPDPPPSSGRPATPRSSAAVRRTPPATVTPSPAPPAPPPAAAFKPATPVASSRTPSGFRPPSPAAQQIPALERAVSSARPPEAPRSMASADIIGRGPGGTGVIVPARVREGANTAAGPPAPGPAGPSAAGSGGSPFYSQPLPDPIKVKPPAPGGSPGGSTSQEMLNIHDMAQQLRPKPPDPQQVKEWAGSIRRPGSSEPPKQIEKFSGGDPRWTEINQRVTRASDPLYPKDKAVPVRDPDLARLANPDQNYTKGSVDPGLGRMAGKEPRPPTTTERMDAYQQAGQQAAQRREGLVDALRSGNQQQIDRAALQVRADPLAVKQANIRELPEVKTRMNEPMANIQRNMEPGIKNQIARQYGVSPNEVEVVYTSNPSKDPKVHQDADVTVRVRGMDVPADKARPVVNAQFQRAAGGDRVAPGMSPDKFAERHYIESTDRTHRHAFGSSAAEGEQIIHGPKSQPVRDVGQVVGAMEDKYNVARNRATELTGQGRLPEAEVQRGLAMDQTVKSFDGQVKPRVEAMGGRVPDHVQRGMDIMRDVREGRTSPAQAEMDLRRMGETPNSITQKATGLLEAGQKLQGPGRGGVPDSVGNETFVQNVKDRMEIKRLEREAAGGGKGSGGGAASVSPNDTGAFRPVSGQTPLTEGRSSFQEQTLAERATGAVRNRVEDIQDADKALGRRLGIGQLPADASGLRAGVNTAGGAVLGAAAAYGSFQTGQGIGENLREGYLDRDMAGQYRAQAQEARQQGNEKAAIILERTAADLENRGAEKYQAAATDTATFGGSLALGATAAVVAPTATGLAGAALVGVTSYNKTRELLENTEAGRKFDKGTEDFMDRGMQAGEALTDQVGRMMGGESKEDRDRAQMTGRQASYDRALERGAITLRDGVTREEFLDYIKYHNPAPGEKDRYTAADYQARLDELISRTPPGTTSPTPVAPQTGGEPPSAAAPVKSRQELDLEAYQQLQALRDLQGGGPKPELAPVKDASSSPEAVIDPPQPPQPPDKGDTGDQDFNRWKSDYVAEQIVDKFGGIQDAQQRQDAIAEYLRNLRDAERSTGGSIPSTPVKPGAVSAADLQLAQNTNVSGSFQQDRDLQQQQEAQQTLGSIGNTQAERAAAAQNQQMQAQSQIQAQGQLTTQAISANAQEFSTSQQNLQVTRQNSLGNILLGSFMGGLTSGVATGIDQFAGGIGRGAGQQVSANWGIQPPPPPPTTGSGSSGSLSESGQAGSNSQTPTTGTGSTGGQTGSSPQTPVQTASTTPGGSTTTSRPPVTTAPATGSTACRTPGTCSYKFVDKNGCCKVCGKKVVKK